jgi:proteasome accessory factor C
MPKVNPKRSRHLKETLNLVSFLANHPGVGVETVREVFGLDRGRLMRALNEILMFGLPPYGPMDYVTAWVEKGTVTVVNADFLRRPLGLTVAEAVSLKVIIDEFLRQSPGVFEQAAASLSKKISAVLGTPGGAAGAISPASGKVSLLERAVDESRAARISYYNRTEDRIAERVVEPLAIVDIDGEWYLVAYCRLRRAERSFRIDRVRDVELLDEKFTPPADFDISRYRREEMFFPSGHETPVRVRFAPESARWAGERFAKWRVEAPQEEGLVCEFPVADMNWVIDLVVEFAPDAVIEGPSAAREAFAKRLAGITRLYR